jgi:hypothetical protein
MIISSLLVGLLWRKHKIKTYQKQGRCGTEGPPSCAQLWASQSGEPPQGAGIPSKPRDAEHLTNIKDKQAQDIPKM